MPKKKKTCKNNNHYFEYSTDDLNQCDYDDNSIGIPVKCHDCGFEATEWYEKSYTLDEDDNEI